MNKKQVNYIIERICEYFKVDRDLLISRSRSHELVFMRFHLMKILRTRAGLSLVKIGLLLNRDHSTVIHGLGEHSNLLLYDDNFKSTWEKLLKLYIDDISIEVDVMESVFTEDELTELSIQLLDILKRERELQREKESILLKVLDV